MTWLLCPACLQWKESSSGECFACGTPLDVTLADPSPGELAERLGDVLNDLGGAVLSRRHLPARGRLLATTRGLLFVPDQPAVLSPEQVERLRHSRSRSWLTRLGEVVVCCVSCCVRSLRRHHKGSRALPVSDRHAVAKLLLSDPGVWFVSRTELSSWRRQQRRWSFIRSDARWWPEKVVVDDSETNQRLQTWLEKTACPPQITH